MEIKLPARKKINLRGELDYYGASHLIAQMGKYTFPPYPKVKSWRHGWWDCDDEVLDPKEIIPFGGKEDLHLVSNKKLSDFLTKKGYVNVRAVGQAIIYAKNIENINRFEKSLLVMPGHVNDNDGISIGGQDNLIKKIQKIRNHFDFVVFCISPPCIRRGNWIRSLDASGFQHIAGADLDDANSLIRMAKIFSSFTHMATNCFGSHIVYANYFGVKVSLLEEMETPIEPEPKTGFMAENLHIWKKWARQFSGESIVKKYKFMVCSPENAKNHIEWAEYQLGEDKRISFEEFCGLFGWKFFDLCASSVFGEAKEFARKIRAKLL